MQEKTTKTVDKIVTYPKSWSASANNNIHPTAIVEQGAVIAEGVRIGPYCMVGKDVVLEENVILKSHVVVEGHTKIGAGTIVYPFAVLGVASNDLKYSAEESTTLEIGKNCTIRESASIHSGTPEPTKKTGSGTVIGDNCLLMAYVHVGHDCKLGNNVIASIGCMFGGEAILEDDVIFGGGCAVHQFCTIGEKAFIGGMTKVIGDIPPFTMADGNPSALTGLNLVGLKRRGIAEDEIRVIKNIYKALYFSKKGGTWDERLSAVKEEYSKYTMGKQFIDFLENKCRRGSLKHRTK